MAIEYSSYQVLRNRFPANEYVLIGEVSDKSGFSRSRSLDYMLINLWESRGLAITGIEVKSSRSDWLRELKNPKKQENHFMYCDYFYLLTDRPNVALPDEIPISWGHYHIGEKGILKTIKQAPKLNSTPVDRSLLCAMLRRAASKEGFVHRSEIEERIKLEAENVQKRNIFKHNEEIEKFQTLQKSIKEFEEAAGIELSAWSSQYVWRMKPKDVGAAIKILMNNRPEDILQHMELLKSNADRIYNTVNKAIEEIKTFVEKEKEPT